MRIQFRKRTKEGGKRRLHAGSEGRLGKGAEERHDWCRDVVEREGRNTMRALTQRRASSSEASLTPTGDDFFD
jgi:hypothetical protein